MDYTYLGDSDIKVSQLGFGCCPLGEFGWGDTRHDELINTVRYAFQNGVTFFDTADVYGFGKSEENLKKAIGNHRKEIVIATKFGMRKAEKGGTFLDNSPKWIRQAVEESLRRLGTDYIDLYQLHWWDEKTAFDDIFFTLEKLKEEGKIRSYGLTNSFDEAFIDKAKNLISFSFEYSLANREHEEKIKSIIQKNTGFISWGSLGQGILSGKYDKNVKFSSDDRRSRDIYSNFYGEKLLHNLRILDQMKKISHSHNDCSLVQIAIRWIIDFLGEGVVLVGVKSINQIGNNIKAFDWKLDAHEVKELEAVSSNVNIDI